MYLVLCIPRPDSWQVEACKPDKLKGTQKADFFWTEATNLLMTVFWQRNRTKYEIRVVLLSVHLIYLLIFIYFSLIYISVYVSVFLFICNSFCLFHIWNIIYLYMVSIYLSIYQSIFTKFIYLSIYYRAGQIYMYRWKDSM